MENGIFMTWILYYTRFSEMVQIYVLIQETDGNDVLMIFMIWKTKRWIIIQIITQHFCGLKLNYDKNYRLIFIWSNTGDSTSRKANARGFLPWPTVHYFFSSFAVQEFFRVIADSPPPPPPKKNNKMVHP